eukprot:m.163665 g.163665  ORF g.163665 m.163665 type:complete len:1097 (+) comp16556_c0_seq5:174-3464(+)
MTHRYQYDSDDDFQPRMSQPIAVATSRHARVNPMAAPAPPPLDLNGDPASSSLSRHTAETGRSASHRDGSMHASYRAVPPSPYTRGTFASLSSSNRPTPLRRRVRSLKHADTMTPVSPPRGIPPRRKHRSEPSLLPDTSLPTSNDVFESKQAPNPDERTPLTANLPPSQKAVKGSPLMPDDGQGKAPGSFCQRVLEEYGHAFLFGVINAIIIVPVVVSYTQIIFSDPFFKPHLPLLVKLLFFSSVVHQTCFTLMSSLPFAIGQVQDAGLIFLSAMATKVVHTLSQGHHTDEEILATTVVWIGLSTALLGLALYVTGLLKLASIVQYLPMPVVGGYLSYIGLYSLQAGLALMADVSIGNAQDWQKLFHPDVGVLIAPGLACGLLLLIVSRTVSHFAALPLCLLAIPSAFYVVLFSAGYSMQDARDAYSGHGWVAQETPDTQFYHVWQHFKFGLVQWHVIPSLLPTWLAMYVVVAFSSCLDVAAIQMELGRALDFNHELKTVGLSNLFSGLTGGQTGSYIFSQTLLTCRAGVTSKVNGVVIMVCCLLMFMLPMSLLQYTPKFFFGAVLVFIGFDLMWDWLISSFQLVSRLEYVIVWGTLIAIVAFGNLELGFVTGIGLCLVMFIIEYAREPTSHKVRKHSNVIRGFKQRQLLSRHHRGIVTLELSGHIFFGKAVGLLKEVESQVVVQSDVRLSVKRSLSAGRLLRIASRMFARNTSDSPEPHFPLLTEDTEYPESPTGGYGQSGRLKALSYSQHSPGYDSMDVGAESPVRLEFSIGLPSSAQSTRTDLSLDDSTDVLPSRSASSRASQLCYLTEVTSGFFSAPPTKRLVQTYYLVLDFTNVTGIDATAIRSCFMILRQRLQRFGVVLLFSGLRDAVHRLMAGQGVLPHQLPTIDAPEEPASTYLVPLRPVDVDLDGIEPVEGVVVLPNLDLSLEWCEDKLLETLEVSHTRRISVKEPTVIGIMYAYGTIPHHSTLTDDMVDEYFDNVSYEEGAQVFRKGDVADRIYFIIHGGITLYKDDDHKRIRRYDQGGLFGEMNFLLLQQRWLNAAALDHTVVAALTRSNYERMQLEEPMLFTAVQATMLKSMARIASDNFFASA